MITKKLESKGWPWTDSMSLAVHSEKNSWPKISIVTPSYNQGQYIEETILSVINQNYPNLEYIIIDGGSTDNTLEIIKKYEQHITYWVSEPDQGQSHAINKGLEQCTGDIFGWINSDDYYCENALNIVGANFADDIHVLCGYSRRFDNEKGPESSDVKFARTSLYYELEKDLLSHYFIQVPTFFKYSVVKELGGVDRNLHFVMDSELWLRYLLKYQYNNIKFIDDLLANYRLHNSSKTVDQQQGFQEEMSTVYQRLYASLGFPDKEIELLVYKPLRIINYGKSYLVADISKIKLRKYAYWKSLGQVGSMQDFRRFFKLLKKVILLSPFAFGTYQQIISSIILPRLLFKIKRA